MKRQHYHPSSLAQQGNWNGNFADKTGTYESDLPLTPAQVTRAVSEAQRNSAVERRVHWTLEPNQRQRPPMNPNRVSAIVRTNQDGLHRKSLPEPNRVPTQRLRLSIPS